ncbi:MAG: uroporphyrinogen decarboxylase family protein [Clostridia bacterium]
MKYDIRQTPRTPDYRNLLKVLERNQPDRPTLFEFFLNDDLYAFLNGKEILEYRTDNEYQYYRMMANAVAGYDYIALMGTNMVITREKGHRKDTVSLNDGDFVTDRKAFDAYPWPDPDDYDYSRLDYVSERLVPGMRMVTYGPGGILENAIGITGYDNMCYMDYDDPVLLGDIFEKVTDILVGYYKNVSYREDVCAVISNDDWGFNTQTMLSYVNMEKYVFPGHRRIVNTIHQAGKPAILHSCGNMREVMGDIINTLGYDAKHSYEDNILPVEKAYAELEGKIAVLGGIDLDFVCRSRPEEVHERSRDMLCRGKTGYALGSGNSIPSYVPIENYMAMISAVYE